LHQPRLKEEFTVTRSIHLRSKLPVVVAVLGGLGLSACATEDYVNKQIAPLNDRINQVDAKATAAGQRADAAAAAAQTAQSAADAAAAAAQQANQRVDQLSSRLDAIEAAAQRMKRPRN
jgi:hypothetical protein